MNIIKYINRLFVFASFLIFIYVVFLLILNTSSGFDITDESYYILAATQPASIFPTVTHEGYYTGILYFISGHDLSYFRVLGIIVLLSVSVWFSIELLKNISNNFNFVPSIWDNFLFIIVIPVGTLAYYRSWSLTPSYNWLALISVILVFTLLIRIVNNKEKNYNKFFSLDYVLLSFTLSLSFMAKPTTALILTIIAIVFVIYEHRNINLKKAFLSVIVLTTIIVVAHIILLDGGFNAYYHRLIEGMERGSLLGGGHTLESRLTSMSDLFQAFFFEKFYFHQISSVYIYGVISIITVLFMIRDKNPPYMSLMGIVLIVYVYFNSFYSISGFLWVGTYYIYGVIFIITVLLIIRDKINSLNVYMSLMGIVLIVYAYFMYQYSFNSSSSLLWIRTVELLLLNLTLIFLGMLFIDNKMEFLKSILKALLLLLIIILGSLAYSFGTNNNIIYAMSGSVLFVVALMLTVNHIFDNVLPFKIFTALSGLIISIVIYFVINNAYEYPYRLITNIKNQNQPVELYGKLKVDQRTKKYIEDLKRIANNNKHGNERISLIDMTGASPGVNVILDAGFFGQSWLLGGYKGSDQFAYRILSTYKNTIELNKAWILTAPKGKRKLDLNILNKIDLNFPNDYKKIGTVNTAHRNEVQELWKPYTKVQTR